MYALDQYRILIGNRIWHAKWHDMRALTTTGSAPKRLACRAISATAELVVIRCRQVVHDAPVCRMSGADTTGRDGDVDTRPRDPSWRRSRDLSRALFRVRPLRRRRTSAVSRRTLRHTRN